MKAFSLTSASRSDHYVIMATNGEALGKVHWSPEDVS